jgi:hypothetical protein
MCAYIYIYIYIYIYMLIVFDMSFLPIGLCGAGRSGGKSALSPGGCDF